MTTYNFGFVMIYVAVHQHGPLSLYTKLKNPSFANLDFFFLGCGLCMTFKSPLDFMVTTLGSCVKRP